MLVTEFDYHLPPDLIAREPLADRAAARMLHLDRRSGTIEDLSFRQLPTLLRAGDLVVFNNTKVIPARLFGHRSGSRAQSVSARNPAARNFLQGTVEVVLVRQLGEWDWEALVRPGRKIGVGEQLTLGANEELHADVMERGEYGVRRLRFRPVADFFGTLEQAGHVPLPPYIDREDQPFDKERYQTVYARECGSVAAPTAGLHFTPEILKALRQGGVDTAEITLHVGLGTFQPIHKEQVEENVLHSEKYNISAEAAEKINAALEGGRRVVAIGTTSVRTLEHAAREVGRVAAGSGETRLFIYPGFQFRVVGAMLTNFHLPQSTLLMLVSAFARKEHTLAAYRHAVEQRYRFYSYGDCMFIE